MKIDIHPWMVFALWSTTIIYYWIGANLKLDRPLSEGILYILIAVATLVTLAWLAPSIGFEPLM